MKKMFLLAALLCFANSSFSQTIQQKIVGTWVCNDYKQNADDRTLNLTLSFQNDGTGTGSSNVYFNGNLLMSVSDNFSWTITNGILSQTSGVVKKKYPSGQEEIDTKYSYTTAKSTLTFESSNVMVLKSKNNPMRFIRIK